MDHFFTDEQKEIQHLVRSIAEKEIRPVVTHYDKRGEFPWPIVKILAQNDIFRVFIEESYEGTNQILMDLIGKTIVRDDADFQS